MAVKIFFCYAHEDEALLNKLKTHLSPLHRQGLIEMWHDRDISAGTDWEQEIKEQLDAAQIILLLVSPDFLASDYCYSIEMARAMKRHEREEAVVIPIILRSVYFQKAPFGKLQALPTDAKPVKSWSDLDEAFFNVAEGIHKTIKSMAMYQGDSSQTTGQTITSIKTIIRCTRCHARIGDEVVICPSCSKPYHRHCWFGHDICANYTCTYPIRTTS